MTHPTYSVILPDDVAARVLTRLNAEGQQTSLTVESAGLSSLWSAEPIHLTGADFAPAENR